MKRRFMAIALIFMLCFSLIPVEAKANSISAVPNKVPAFPGAEGGGMYTTGGRGGEVYEVTNLNDEGPGSLREGISQPNRIIVFRVSGNIGLKSSLEFNQPNITIAGQTAPGDGICIQNYDTIINADNIIIRYIRFRPSDAMRREQDAFTARYHKNLVIDHCTFTWSVDEVCSVYQMQDTTVQWSIMANSLALSEHSKGRHGYGGIDGGQNTTFHHNIIANNVSRNLALSNDLIHDHINNVVYNWGGNSGYGGNPASKVNVINNYYKYGPDTIRKVRNRIYSPSDGGNWYVNGNFVEGYSEITADNWNGGVQPYDQVSAEHMVKLEQPYPLENVPAIESAEVAYESVLANAGAVLPKRDPLDAKLVNDIKNNTGRVINSSIEEGGWPELQSVIAPLDNDHDGMPDEWEKNHGLDPNNAEDRNGDYNGNGYTNVEKYINSITTNGSLNPEVTITSPSVHQMLQSHSDVIIHAEASDKDGSISKVEFWKDNEKLGESENAPYDFVWRNVPEGTYYLTAKAVDNTRTSTFSSVIIVHVNDNGSILPWISQDIGDVSLVGSASKRDNTYSIKGTGAIGGQSDAFQYMYQSLQGNGSMIVQLDAISKLNNDCIAGIMLRNQLTPQSSFVAISYDYQKGGQSIQFLYRDAQGNNTKSSFVEFDKIPCWLKLTRNNNTFIAYYSEDGGAWTQVGCIDIPMEANIYAGVAVDSNKEDNETIYYNDAKFSYMDLVQYNAHEMPVVDFDDTKETYTTGEKIIVTVNAETKDADITKVELYVEGKKYAEMNKAPFSFSINGINSGTFKLTAVVSDSQGAQTVKDFALTINTSAFMLDYPAASVVGGRDNTNKITAYTLNPAYVATQIQTLFCKYETQIDSKYFKDYKNYIGRPGNEKSTDPYIEKVNLPVGSYTLYYIGQNSKDINMTLTDSAGHTVTASRIKEASYLDCENKLTLNEITFEVKEAITGGKMTFTNSPEAWLPDLYAIKIVKIH